VIFSKWSRKSLRLPGYFLTVCVQGRNSLFGEVANEAMQLNSAGRMVERWWSELQRKFPDISIDSHVVMPNHFHGIIFKSNEPPKGAHPGAPLQKMVQWFKTMSTNEYIHGVKEHGWPPFEGPMWQRSFYEHVIRDEESLNRIREYIATNPQRWDLDRENPRAKGKDEFDEWLATVIGRPSLSICRGAPTCAPSTLRGLGDAGEDLAAAALKQQGYKVLERNYACPLGEIDLIARQGKYLVFVEVKTRKSARFGSPQEAVHAAKQARLRRLADYYLKQKRLHAAMVRFDVVAITLAESQPRVEIFQNAF
jgi:putative transposase